MTEQEAKELIETIIKAVGFPVVEQCLNRFRSMPLYMIERKAIEILCDKSIPHCYTPSIIRIKAYRMLTDFSLVESKRACEIRFGNDLHSPIGSLPTRLG